MRLGTFARISIALVCALLAFGLFTSAASASTVIFSDDFESAFQGWTVSGHPSWYTGSPKIGTHDVRLAGKNSSIQRTVSTFGWQEITVSFWLGAKLSRKGATCQALWFDGATWIVLKQFRTGDSDADGQLHYFEFALPSAATNNGKFALRFRLSSKSSNDSAYLDDVAVVAASRFMYRLTLAGANGSVKVNGVPQALPWSGTLDYGASVVIQAVADSGYHFTGWSGALTGSANPAIIVMDGNKDITASFAVDSYTLAVGSGTGNGSIKADGVQHSLPWAGTYDGGTVVMLEAVPDAGYHFAGWAGGLTGTTNPAFITMSGNENVSVGFGNDTYALLLSGVGSGGVKVNGVYHALPDSITAAHGSTVTLEAAPDTGWHFTGWSGDLTGSTDPTFIVIDSDKSVTVGFALNQYAVNLSGIGNGSVKVDGTDHSLPWLGTYNYGDIVVLQAVPAADSHFTSWSGDLSSFTNPTVVVVDGAKDITAGFGLNTYTLAVTGTNGTVKVNGAPKILPWSGMFAAGEVVYLEAVSTQGFQFASWSGDLSGSANPTTITMNGDRAVSAEFGANLYTLTVSGTHGSLNVDGVAQALPYTAFYDYAAVVSLEAVPDTGYQFAGWSGDLTDMTNPVDVTITGSMTIAASFSLGRYTLSLSGTGGTVKVDGATQTLPWSGQYDYGTAVTLEAVEDSCTRFSGWSGSLDGRDSPVLLLMDGDKSIAAGFDSIVVFNDVACDAWGAREIAACFFEGTVQGYTDGSYKPKVAVTRDQMAAYIARALAGGDEKVPDFTGTPSFGDAAGNWALKYIEYAVSQNVVRGYTDGYHPTEQVTRAQMAVFIARAMVAPAARPDLGGYMPPVNPTFPDVTSANGWKWAYKFVEYAAGNGTIKGYPEGNYRPDETCTRDQMAVYIARAFKLPL
jgi:uncharacterized repeat protein (TIGR02543 family)